jgi:hypothetical protein
VMTTVAWCRSRSVEDATGLAAITGWALGHGVASPSATGVILWSSRDRVGATGRSGINASPAGRGGVPTVIFQASPASSKFEGSRVDDGVGSSQRPTRGARRTPISAESASAVLLPTDVSLVRLKGRLNPKTAANGQYRNRSVQPLFNIP